MSDIPVSQLSASRSEAPDALGVLDLVLVFSQSWKVVVLGALAAGLIALGFSFLLTPQFTARASFLVPQQQNPAAALAQLGGLAGAAATATGLKNPLDQYVAMLRSTTVTDKLVSQFDLMTMYGERFRQDARDVLTRRTQVVAGKDGLITIEVEDTSPIRAAELANAYMAQLSLMLDALAADEAQHRRTFFEQQLGDANKRLIQAQTELEASGVDASTLKMNPAGAVEATARLKAQLTASELRVAGMRGYLSDNSAELRQALLEQAALRRQLQQAEVGQGSSRGQPNEYILKFREFKYRETLFEMFARQYELARADEAREGALVQVIDKATPPEKKTSPRKAVIAVVTTIASGTLLYLFALASYCWAAAVRDPARARKASAIRSALSRRAGVRRGTAETHGNAS
jgi:tyrosine-protein kinase Etk/Wzc